MSRTAMKIETSRLKLPSPPQLGSEVDSRLVDLEPPEPKPAAPPAQTSEPAPEQPASGATVAPKKETAKEDPERLKRDQETAEAIAKDLHLAGQKEDTDAVIFNVRKAMEKGHWQRVQDAFWAKHQKDVRDWLPQELDASDVKEYAQIFYAPNVVEGAEAFYDLCFGPTGNHKLAKFVDEKGKSAQVLVDLMICYGENYYWHNPNNEHKTDAFSYPANLSARERRMIDRFSSVLEYELEDTGYLSSTRAVIQAALDTYGSSK